MDAAAQYDMAILGFRTKPSSAFDFQFRFVSFEFQEIIELIMIQAYPSSHELIQKTLLGTFS